MKKRTFYSEIAYFLGLALLAFSTALMAWGDFGMSMVVAPAYILYLKLSQTLSWFSFGIAEYVLQACVLLLMVIVLRKVRLSYLLSFLAALLYGLILDGSTALLSHLTPGGVIPRLLVYILGDVGCSAGIALLLRSYLPPEVYELFIKEISAHFGWKFSAVKTVYDCASLTLATLMSLFLLGSIQGVGVGTVACALLNGTLIQLISRLYDKVFTFRDRFSCRSKFEESEDPV